MALLPWALLPSHHEGPFRPPEPCCRCPSKEQRRLFPSGCQAMSVYSGSDYTESNCYDQKQVEADLSIEISSNASGQQHHCNHLHPPKDPHHELHYNANNRPLSTSLSGTGTGSRTSVRRSGWSKLYCKPQCFKGNLYLMFFSVWSSLSVLAGAWSQGILWGPSFSPNGAHTGGALVFSLEKLS